MFSCPLHAYCSALLDVVDLDGEAQGLLEGLLPGSMADVTDTLQALAPPTSFHQSLLV